MLKECSSCSAELKPRFYRPEQQILIKDIPQLVTRLETPKSIVIMVFCGNQSGCV